MKKLTIEEMRKITESRGGKCLSKEYINNHTKIKWQCSKGHTWEATSNSIKSGSWCPKCSIKSGADKRRGTIEGMKEIAISRDGRCLSKEYVNSITKLKWQCKEGHIWEASPSNIKYGRWCPKCGIKSAADNLRGNIREMQKIAEDRSGKCLSKKYINSNTKLKWQCKEGHAWEAVPHSIKSGTWCPKCSMKSRIDKNLLYNLYIKQKKSTRKIAKILKCSATGVCYYLHKYNIPVRHPQKKINLNQSLLYDMYIKQGKSCEKISKVFGCSLDTVLRYLREYNIPVRKRPSSFKIIKIEGIGEQVLLGSLLGDGSIEIKKYGSECPVYGEKHCARHQEYLKWKQKMLPFTTRGREYLSCTEGKYHPMYRVRSGVHYELLKYYNMKYRDEDGLQKILNKLNDFGLMIWYLDDGSFSYRGKICRLATNNLSHQQHLVIQKWFEKNYGITAGVRIVEKRKKHFNIVFNINETQKFLKIFQIYMSNIPKCMYYKFSLDKRKQVEAEKKVKEYQKQYDQRLTTKNRKRKYYQKYRDKILRRQKQYQRGPEVKKRRKEWGKEYEKLYRQRPEVIKRRKEHWQRPEVKERRRRYLREYYQRPEMKERRRRYLKEYKQRPEVQKRYKKWRKEYRQKPKVKEKDKQYRKQYEQRPGVKEKRKQYRRRPEIKERYKKYMEKYRKQYYQKHRDEILKKQKEYEQRPEIKKRKKEDKQRLKVKERRKKYMKEYSKQYRQRPEVKAKKTSRKIKE